MSEAFRLEVDSGANFEANELPLEEQANFFNLAFSRAKLLRQLAAP